MKIDVFFGNPLLREIAAGWLHGLEAVDVNAVGVSPQHFRLPHREPDVVLVVWPYSFTVEHFEYYRKSRKVLVTTDDPFEIDHTKIVARNYDLVVTHEPTTLDIYSDAICLPFAFARFLDEAPIVAEIDKQIDVCFFGGLYPPRRGLLEVLDRRGFHCVTSLGRSRRVPVEECYSITRSAKINLNIHRQPAEADYDHCSNRRELSATSLNSRFYQLGGLGCFQLVYSNRETPAEIGDDQRFSDAEELIAAVEYFLERPDERIKRAAMLRERILASDCIDHRAATLLGHLESIRTRPKSAIDLDATAVAQSVLRPHLDDFSNWVGTLRE